jgi:hypothetical protein
VNGETKTTCCVACGRHFKSKPAVLLTVTDFPTGKELDPLSAHYLLGSDITGCGPPAGVIHTEHSNLYLCYDNCRPSILAFEQRRGALKVQKEHGGKLITYQNLPR